jgi:hypothetical protein
MDSLKRFSNNDVIIEGTFNSHILGYMGMNSSAIKDETH